MYFTPILLMLQHDFLSNFYKDMPHSNHINVCFDRKSKFEGMMQSGGSQVHQSTFWNA